MIVKFKKIPGNFITIERNVIDFDSSISFRAKGILAYLMGRPDDWKPNQEEIQRHSKDKIYSVKSGIQELKKAGYVKITRKKHSDGKKYWEWIVSDKPIEGVKPKVEKTESRKSAFGQKPKVENQLSGNSAAIVVNSAITESRKTESRKINFDNNKENNKKEYNNKEKSTTQHNFSEFSEKIGSEMPTFSTKRHPLKKLETQADVLREEPFPPPHKKRVVPRSTKKHTPEELEAQKQQLLQGENHG